MPVLKMDLVCMLYITVLCRSYTLVTTAQQSDKGLFKMFDQLQLHTELSAFHLEVLLQLLKWSAVSKYETAAIRNEQFANKKKFGFIHFKFNILINQA